MYLQRLQYNAALLLFLIVPAHLQAMEYQCSNNEENRFIRLELPGQEHLCEVSVTTNDDQRRVMWYADHDSSFCSEKIRELKNKYESQWKFSCEKWPDIDGVDALSARHRTILDAELKLQLKTAAINIPPYRISSLRVAANSISSDGNSTLVVQFFRTDTATGASSDETQIISDNGVSWNTITRLEGLINYVQDNSGYAIDHAVVSSITDSGALEISTFLSNHASAGNTRAACYGSQIVATDQNGRVAPKTPHRFVCTGTPPIRVSEGAG